MCGLVGVGVGVEVGVGVGVGVGMGVCVCRTTIKARERVNLESLTYVHASRGCQRRCQ